MANKHKSEKEKAERLSTFKTAVREMIATSDDSYSSITTTSRSTPLNYYTKEEALDIIHNGNPEALKDLSIAFFYTSGFYKRLLLYFATLLDYSILTVPHLEKDTSSPSTQVMNKYEEALGFIDNLNIKTLFTEFALKVFVEGAYYGILSTNGDGKFSVLSLPFAYCRSRFKTYEGNIDVIEFDVRYFDRIYNKASRDACIKTFPDEIRIAYNSYKNHGTSSWYQVPIEAGIHFKLYDERPFFSNIIPAVIDFDEYREIEKAKDKQDLKKIIVQEMPHTNDGELVFEPEEVELMHKGVVNMVKNAAGVDILTSFGEVDVHDLQSVRSTIANNLEKISDSIYTEAGVSKQLFSADTATSLNRTIENDTGLVMILGNQFANWLTFVINNNFKTGGISFNCHLLPITFFNRFDMFKNSVQGATYGYSFLIPALCLGISQSNFLDLKKLENDILKLDKVMIPLQSANTQSGKETEESGRAKAEQDPQNDIHNQKSDGNKSEKTIENINSGGQE